MKTVTIPESEYKALQDTNNSLRKLLSQFTTQASELLNGDGATPNAPKPKKMTRKDYRESFLRKIK